MTAGVDRQEAASSVSRSPDGGDEAPVATVPAVDEAPETQPVPWRLPLRPSMRRCTTTLSEGNSRRPCGT